MSVFNKNTSRVLSYDVLRQQKTGIMIKGVVSGGLTSAMYNVEPVTNISSSSCANNGRRTPRCARCSPPSVAALFFTVRDSYMVDNTVDLYAAKPDIRPESRFLRTPPAFDAPLEGFPSECCYAVWYGKTRMVWLPDGEKISKIYLFVLAQFTNVTDGQTDRQTNRHRTTT